MLGCQAGPGAEVVELREGVSSMARREKFLLVVSCWVNSQRVFGLPHTLERNICRPKLDASMRAS